MVIFYTSGSGATDKPKVYVLDCVNGWIKTWASVVREIYFVLILKFEKFWKNCERTFLNGSQLNLSFHCWYF